MNNKELLWKQIASKKKNEKKNVWNKKEKWKSYVCNAFKVVFYFHFYFFIFTVYKAILRSACISIWKQLYGEEKKIYTENERLAKKYKFPFLALLVHHFTLKFFFPFFSSLLCSFGSEIAHTGTTMWFRWMEEMEKKGKLMSKNIKTKEGEEKSFFFPHQAFFCTVHTVELNSSRQHQQQCRAMWEQLTVVVERHWTV